MRNEDLYSQLQGLQKAHSLSFVEIQFSNILRFDPVKVKFELGMCGLIPVASERQFSVVFQRGKRIIDS